MPDIAMLADTLRSGHGRRRAARLPARGGPGARRRRHHGAGRRRLLRPAPTGGDRPRFGGCRLEDIALITEGGCEVLTDYRYDMRPELARGAPAWG